ncbi:MAG: radical SAM protein [Candidatus Bathyarchaeota archaeon]|nr:radical SAM protein [Candidatus Bathyarchaeota archaeon]
MWKLLRPNATEVLNDPTLKRSLARYFAVAQNEKPPKFKIAQKTPANFSFNDPLEKLWQEHEKVTGEFGKIEQEIASTTSLNCMRAPEKSYFSLKLEIAGRILQNCHFCSRNCKVNRVLGALGYCKCGGGNMTVSSIFAHMGEEPELVPSGTVFTMGCTIRCRHCQNWTISQWMEKGAEFTPQALAKEVDNLRFAGCRNVNLVGGEPTPWLFQWLQTFRHVEANVPVVWNSNSYYSPETAKLLAGFVDVYLLDFKYGPSGCAEKISEAPNYWDACTANHLQAKKHGEVIVRVLVLPGHLECCTLPILNWISKNLGAETRVNVMSQYRPQWRAREIPELRRRPTRVEMRKAVQAAKKAGLKNRVS